jgi:hypothetical protein
MLERRNVDSLLQAAGAVQRPATYRSRSTGVVDLNAMLDPGRFV